MPKGLTPVLVLHEGDKPKRALFVRSAAFVIGRDDGCDLVLADPSVSGRHAEIKTVGDKRIIDDLESDSGIHVGGRRVEFHVLRPGDCVQIGGFLVEYFEDDAAKAAAESGASGWKMDAAKYRELVERQGSMRVDEGIKHVATISSEDDPSQSWKPGEGMVFGAEGVPVEGLGASAQVVWDGRAHVIRRQGWRASLSVRGQIVDSHVLVCGDRFQVGKSKFHYG